MSEAAAKHIGEGIAWLGFWLSAGAVVVAAIMNGWKPWQ